MPWKALALAIGALAATPAAASAEPPGAASCRAEAASLEKDLKAERPNLTEGAYREIGEWLEIARGQCAYNLDYAHDTLGIVRDMLTNSRPSDRQGRR